MRIVLEGNDPRNRRRHNPEKIRGLSSIEDYVLESFVDELHRRKQEDEDKKKKEEEKKKNEKKTRNFSALEWFLLLIVSYPFIGPLYLYLIKYSWEQTSAVFK